MAAEAITFTGEALDRAAEHRGDPDWLTAQAADPAARGVLAGDAGVHVTGDDEPRLALLPLSALDAAAPLLLGLDTAGPVFAVDADGGSGRTIGAGDWDGRVDGTGT